MSVSIKDLDNDNASFSEGTLTDVEVVDDNLQLANNYDLSFDGVDDYVDTNGATNYFGIIGTWNSDTTDEGSIDGFSDVRSIT